MARMRFILLILVAVVSSMTLHHGAMAGSHGIDDVHLADWHHHSESDCTNKCAPDDHSMPFCCGMGLCLSGMPTGAAAAMPVRKLADVYATAPSTAPRWLILRIDRPPKGFLA